MLRGTAPDRVQPASRRFRPGRSQHDALDALAVGLHRRKVGTVLDADIRAFFDTISRISLTTCLSQDVRDWETTRSSRPRHSGGQSCQVIKSSLSVVAR